jgi:hypothetical protein
MTGGRHFGGEVRLFPEAFKVSRPAGTARVGIDLRNTHSAGGVTGSGGRDWEKQSRE